MGRGPVLTTATSDPVIMATDAPLFNKEKHISYWLRCFRSPLPHHYTSQDANRMTLAFFIVSALDLLGVLFTRTSHPERVACIDWIYRCQHPDGGFRGFPATDFGRKTNNFNKIWDPANVPATYFALSALAVLGDDLTRVRRKQCLQWLTKMQRSDGSFGETLGENDSIEGGRDMRFGYTATMVRWILRGDAVGDVEGVADVDVLSLVSCIRGSEAYDGGISEAPYHEAHAGFTYCAIGVLSLLKKLPQPNGNRAQDGEDATNTETGLSSYDKTIQWLLFRLTTTIEEEEESEDEDEDEIDSEDENDGTAISDLKSGEFFAGQQIPSKFDSPNPSWTGFNGRANKMADTCYAWWVGASLEMLDALSFIDHAPLRRYLIEKTQHLIAGGFGKIPGAPPDLYHAYLGLAALSMLEASTTEEEVVIGPAIEEGQPNNHGQDAVGKSARILRRLDPAACFSIRAKEWIEGLSWRRK